MKLLFLASWFPSRVHPTHGNFVARHARTVAVSHDLTVVSIHPDPTLPPGATEKTDEVEAGYRCVRVYYGAPPSAPSHAKVRSRLRAYRQGLTGVERPDLIHAHVTLDAGIVAAFLGTWWRRPYVVTEHSTVYQRAGRVRGLRLRLIRWAGRRAEMLMPVSKQLGRCMRAHYGIRGKYRPVGNVVDTGLYRPSPTPDKIPFTFLHVSNFGEAHKNISGLLRAFRNVAEQREHPTRLHLAGDGDLAAVERQIAEAGVDRRRIRLSGPHSESEIAESMRSAHAFVLFSNYENQPVVLLEAQCSGLPCVATRVGGVPEILGSETGNILVAAGDEAELSGAMLRLIDRYDAIDRIAMARAAAARHGESAIRAAFTQVYEAVKQKTGA